MKPTSIYSCIWFENQGGEAAEFYCSLFADGKILQSTPMVSTFEIGGLKLMALNGGPQYKPSSAFSYYIYCGSKSETERLYKALSENGSVLMPLDRYAWSESYAWVKDRFGVDWQLDMDAINAPQKIVPSLLFANAKDTLVQQALNRYQSVFNPFQVIVQSPYPAGSRLEGSLLFTQFKINGFLMNIMSSEIPHSFDFGPGNSMVIECETQEEIDHYWQLLGEGGRYDMCGWLSDQFGISWQIVPKILSQLMQDPEKGPRVIQAFLKMQKFDIATLLNA